MSGVELKGLKGLSGLDGLIKDSKQNRSSFNDTLLSLPIDNLVPGKYQPRTNFIDQSLQELSCSIKENGIIQPIIVRKINLNQYEIIAGERRWRAAKIAGLTYVPAIVRDIPDDTAMVFAIIENIQREDLNPIDQAAALVRLSEEFSMTHEQIAKTVGFSRSAVTNLIRLLALTDKVKEFLKNRKLEIGHAKTLMTLDDSDQEIIASKIIEKDLSVREAEQLVKRNKKPDPSIRFDIEHSLKIKKLVEILSDNLSRSVNVQLNNKGVGKIEMKVYSFKDAEWLVNNLTII